MVTQTKEAPTGTEQKKTSGVLQTVKKDVKPLQELLTKFNNDWVMNFAAGLAFNLITAIVPIVIALISIVGFIFGWLDPSVKANLINRIHNVFPAPISAGNVLEPALASLNKNAGLLGTIAVLAAIFAGSRLFVTLEGYFDIIYHTRQRNFIKQNLMAFGMLLVFVVLVPLMVFAASIPALVQSLLHSTFVNSLPGIGLLFSLIGILVGLLIAWVLFEAIYIVVPNQHISFRNSWLGAVVAAVALQIYLILFPFYVTHFLANDTGKAGFALILLFFFYYFAVILLLGAEINAFFAEHVRSTPDNLVVMIHKLTSHLPTSEKEIQEQAPPSHKNEEPKDIRPKSEAEALEAEAAKANQGEKPPGQVQPASSKEDHPAQQKEKRKSSSNGSSRALTLVEAVVGTSLAFFVQLFRLRRKKE
jgi:membrane protein